MLALDEEVGEPAECEAATDQVARVGGSNREMSRPSHLKQSQRALSLERWILNAQQLSTSRFLIKQEENAVCTDIQRIGVPENGGGLCFLPCDKFVATGGLDGKPSIEASLTRRNRYLRTGLVVHNGVWNDWAGSRRASQRSEDSVDKISSH